MGMIILYKRGAIEIVVTKIITSLESIQYIHEDILVCWDRDIPGDLIKEINTDLDPDDELPRIYESRPYTRRIPGARYYPAATNGPGTPGMWIPLASLHVGPHFYDHTLQAAFVLDPHPRWILL